MALTRPAHLGAVHLVQRVAHFFHRRALRRICSDGKADSTRDRCTRDMTRCVLSSIGVLVSNRAAHARVRALRILFYPQHPRLLPVYGAAVAGRFALTRGVGWPRIQTQGGRRERELPLSQHALMTSTKRSGNPACRAVPDARSTLDTGAGIRVLSRENTRRGLPLFAPFGREGDRKRGDSSATACLRL